MTLDENREQWQSEKKDAAEFWDSFLTNLRRVKAERAAKDPVYIPEPISWDIMIGATSFRFNFQPSDLANLSSILANEGYPTFEGLENNLNLGLTDLDSDIAAKEPKRDDYFLTANYIKSREEWERNRKEANDFFAEFAKRLDEAKKEREKNDPVYKPRNIKWGARSDKYHFSVAYGEENNLAAMLSEASQGLFKWIEDNTEWQKRDSLSISDLEITSIKTKPFFSEENRRIYIEEVHKQKDRIAKFYDTIESELKRIRKEREQADPKYQWIPVEWISNSLNGKRFEETTALNEDELDSYTLQNLKDAQDELRSFEKDTNKLLNERKPKQKDYFLKEHYTEAFDLWKDNGQRLTSFIAKIRALLRQGKPVDPQERKQRIKNPIYPSREPKDPKYIAENTVWNVRTEKFEHAFGYESEVEIAATLSKAPSSAIEWMNKNKEQAEKDFIRLLENKAPEKANFSSDASFYTFLDEWKKEKARAVTFWIVMKKVLAKIGTVDAPKEPPKTAREFIDRLEAARVKELGIEKAQQLNDEAIDRANYTNALQKRKSDLIEEEKELAAREKAWKKLPISDPNYKIARDQYYKDIADFRKRNREWYDDYRDLRTLAAKRENKRTDVNALLDILFPDRGGTSFFDSKSKADIINVFDSKGEQEVGKEILKLYDLVARAYNTSQTTGRIPSVAFHRYPATSNTNGDFTLYHCSIRLSQKITGNRLRKTGAHEFGHWLEEELLGLPQADENTEWLRKEQKAPKIKKAARSDFIISAKEQPNLCVREDMYSQKVYPNCLDPKTRQRYSTSEVISTAMEYLIADPEMFARRCPKQFDLLLENLRKLLK